MSLLQGHWYTKDGFPYIEPIESVEQVKDLRLLPGVTTILKICHNHFLSQWIMDQRDKAWFELERFEGETFKDAKSRVNKIANSASSKAKDKGSFVHAVFERYWKELITGKEQEAFSSDNAYEKKIFELARKIHKEYFPTLKPEHCEERIVGKGYAGKFDLAGTFKSHNVMIDFKTQTLKPGKEFFAYPSYWAQVAAYHHAHFKKQTGMLGFIILICPETLKWKVEFQDKETLSKSLSTFFNCLELFRGPMGLGLNV